MTAPLLETVGLRVAYDGVEVLHGIDLTMERGECIGIIGPNGCGKSTLVHTIAGMKSPAGGRVYFAGRDITTTSPRQRLRFGFALVPQGRRVFPQMTVEENLLMGAYLWPQEARKRLSCVVPLLNGLQLPLARTCGSLSSGAQQIVAIARALMSEPTLLLLDEPLLGLSASNQTLVIDTIRDLSSRGTTIAIVEHRVNSLNTVAGRNVIMQNGHVTEVASLVASIAGPDIDTPEIRS